MGRTEIIPLGGLGEIGLNALAVETEEDLILIDCGLQLSSLRDLGVDYLIPDLSYVETRRSKFRGLLLTHGHDDHVGAVPHLLRRFSVPVYGTPMTLGLLEDRMAEVCPEGKRDLRVALPGETVRFGRIAAEWIRVAHSTPESCALGIETPAGRILHTGDFNFDPAPVAGAGTDLAALARWGELGVALLCCDSTNSGRPGRTPSESTVSSGFRRVIAGVHGRLYVATFASHAHRMQQIIHVSREAGRRVALLGRSVVRAASVSRSVGHLRTAPGDLVSDRQSQRLSRARLTVIASGSQAEPGSALWRLAHGLDPHHEILEGDHVFLSARVIPGSEAAVHRLANQCIRLGARVHYGEECGIHVSGHPSAGDVAQMIELTRPRHVLPIHGELRHLAALAEVAGLCGLPEGNVHRIESGRVLILESGEVRLGGSVPAGRRLVDSCEVAELSDGLLSARRSMARGGAVWGVAFPMGEVDAPGWHRWRVRVFLQGVVPDASVEEASGRAAEALRRDLEALTDRGCDPARIEHEMVRGLRRYFRLRGDRRPLIRAVALGGTSER